jgi:hypothetical protein
MSHNPYLYALVRIRKSGSQSLVEMVRGALTSSKFYSMPPVPPTADQGVGVFEDFRRIRRTQKRLRKLFRTMSFPRAWSILNRVAKEGDVVSGHFMFGAPQLPDWELRYITLLRNPVDRLYSEYRYCRQSYLERPAWRRWYLAGRLKVAGRGSFGDYIQYLHSQKDRFANPLVGYITGGADAENPYEFLKTHYFHYGTMERMDLFAQGLSEKLGSPVTTTWKNRTEKVPAADSESYDRDQLQALMAKDIALYEAVAAEQQA